jgi:hypothetical protein
VATLPPFASATALLPEPVPGDANGDSRVDGGDLAIWQVNYDPLGEDNDPWNGFWHGDFNRDGRIDGGDLALWQEGYNPIGFMSPEPLGDGSTQIPEPASLMLALSGIIGLAAKARCKRN